MISDGNPCTADSCDPSTGPTHTPIPSCHAAPVQGNAPFEPRASLMGRLVTRAGGPITGATFTVTEAPPPDGSGTVRGDVSASVGSDGSFRLRLTSFPDTETDGNPPLHVLLRVDASGTLPVFRDAWLHTGSAVDLGNVKMVPRDSAVTPIGPAGGTANDSGNTVQVVIPAGALSSTINVVITPFAARDELPARLPDSTVTMYGFELEPSGTTFSAPVTVRVANSKSLPTTLSIPTGFYDTTVGRWEHVGQATWDGSRFAVTTTHFSPFDMNAKRGNGPGTGPGDPPPPPDDRCKMMCCSGGGGPAGPAGGPSGPGGGPGGPEGSGGPDDDGSNPSGDGGGGDPGEGAGSRAGMTAGAVSQTFRLPTYRVRDEDFGITLGYDSGLAGSRSLGAAPTDYQSVTHMAHAVSVRGLRMQSACVPSAVPVGSSGRGTGSPQQPGLCGVAPSCSLGQSVPVPLRADFSVAGSTITQSFSMGANNTQADFNAFIDLSTDSGIVRGSGLYAAHVVLDSQTPGACVSSGGTFGVADEQATGTQLTVEPGPLATFDYKELVSHRVGSPYGTGWTVQELERVYRSGDIAFLVRGDGSQEKFRPRAYPKLLAEMTAGYRFARDTATGEIFVVSDSGSISRLDPATGAMTMVFSGLPLSGGVRSAAVAYVGSARHFAIALATGLIDVDSGGSPTTLATRTEPPQFRDASVAARGELVFYTDAASTTLYRTRLSDPSHAVTAISTASGGDERLFPRLPLSGVTFADPRGMDFGADGTLYMADVRRNAVYALSPQSNGEVGPASMVSLAVGDGTSTFLGGVGERQPGVKLALREPLLVTTGEDGTLLVVTAFGAAWYDPMAREAEWLVYWVGIDELVFNPTKYAVAALALGPNSFLLRDDSSNSFNGPLVRMDLDRLSSEHEPTRTITKTTSGGLELLDTTRAMIEDFDTAGRITARKWRTGELRMGFAYVDAQSDQLDHLIDPAGGATSFAYDGSGKLQRITDARGRITNVTVTGEDLVSFRKPDLETFHFTYDSHRMTQKQTPRGDVTTYAFRADGTVQTLTKPGGQVTTVDAVLSHPPTYDGSGALVRTGSYTDGHGVTHAIQINSRGDIEKDTYVTDGITRVEQVDYADSFADDSTDIPTVTLTTRQNRLGRVKDRKVNGVVTGPLRDLWDAHGRPLREIPFAFTVQATHRWTYASDGWLFQEQVGDVGTGHQFDRDTAGHVTRMFDFINSGPTGNETVTTYRADGQPATVTMHDTLRTYSYDDAGGTLNETGWVDAVGRSMAYLRDPAGNVTQTNDGTATTFAIYDANNRVIETRDALGNATTYGYNATGCGCSLDSLVTNIHTPDLPAGIDWLMAYDSDNRLASVTDPHSFKESYSYETTGELKKLTDKLLRDTTWTHDQLGRVGSMVDTLGRKHGNLYSVPSSGAWAGPTLMAGSADATTPPTSLTATLPNGHYQIGQNAYPNNGFPAGVTLYRDPTFELSFSRQFDTNKRMTRRFDRTGLAIDTTTAPSTPTFWSNQDSWSVFTPGRVPTFISSTEPGGGGDSANFSQDAFFDATFDDGFWGGSDARMNETFTRDTAGRVTQISRNYTGAGFTPSAFGILSTYTYRPDGRIGRLVNPDGTHDFTYDARGLMVTQVVSGEGTYSYGYDVMGRNNSLEYPDGHTRTQIYDDLGRITSRCYEYSGPTTRCYTAQYDAVGNPTRMTDPDGADRFEYDALDRLKKVTREVDGVDVAVEDYDYNALGALKLNAGVALDHQRPRLDGGGDLPGFFGPRITRKFAGPCAVQ